MVAKSQLMEHDEQDLGFRSGIFLPVIKCDLTSRLGRLKAPYYVCLYYDDGHCKRHVEDMNAYTYSAQTCLPQLR